MSAMAKQEPKREVGRPSDYRPEFCQAVKEAAEIIGNGATDTSIASALDVDVRTIYRWREQFPEFAEACAVAKERADDHVEASLFQRGTGYSHDAVKIFMPAGAPEPVYAKYREHYPPETAAASLWLRNRRPKEWRDRVEHTGADGGPIQTESVDALEIARQLGFALALAAQRVQSPGDGAKVISPSGEAETPKAIQRAKKVE